MKFFTRFLFTGMLLLRASALFAQAGDEHWDYRFGFPGTSYYQNNAAVDPRNGDIYLAGDQFTMAGGIRATNIAKWTRATGAWSALGKGIRGSGTGQYVQYMTVDPRNGNLYVAGSIDTAGDVPVAGFAMWDGSTWSRATPGYNVSVYSMLVDPRNGDLYIGGSVGQNHALVASNICKWNGTTWSTVGAGLNSVANAIALNPTTGVLYAAGSFSQAGGKPIQGFAKWDGTSWDSVGGSFKSNLNPAQISSIALDGNNIYVTGRFSKIGSQVIYSTAKWNGSTWSTLGTDLTDFSGASSLAIIGSDVFMGGNWYYSANPKLSYIARFDGTNWNPLSGTIGGFASAQVRQLLTYGNDLIVIGPQTSAFGNISGKNCAMWNTSTHTWHPLGNNNTLGVDGVILGAAVAPNNDVYVVGDLKAAGYESSPGIARWTGSEWKAVSRGLVFGYGSAQVRRIAIASNGDIYLGGSLSNGINDDSTKSPNSYFAIKYSNGHYSALGNGLDKENVNDIKISGSDVYYGGNFKVFNTSKTQNIARWTGTAWDSLGGGINGTVNSIAIAGNGDVYAGGNFSAAGGNTSIKYLARWNGNAWSDVGGGVNNTVNQLLFKGTTLYVAGNFSQVNGQPMTGLAKWDGTNWDTVASGLRTVSKMAFQGDTLFISGDFGVYSQTATRQAYITGGVLTTLGSGLLQEWQYGAAGSADPNAIVVVGSDVYFAGLFNIAGGRPSSQFARWNSGQTIAGVKELHNSSMPKTFNLAQNYPNPFNPMTGINFTVTTNGLVTLKIYNTLGQEVAILVNEVMHAGSYNVPWNAANAPTGVYFYKLQTNQGEIARKMVLMK